MAEAAAPAATSGTGTIAGAAASGVAWRWQAASTTSDRPACSGAAWQFPVPSRISFAGRRGAGVASVVSRQADRRNRDGVRPTSGHRNRPAAPANPGPGVVEGRLHQAPGQATPPQGFGYHGVLDHHPVAVPAVVQSGLQALQRQDEAGRRGRGRWRAGRSWLRLHGKKAATEDDASRHILAQTPAKVASRPRGTRSHGHGEDLARVLHGFKGKTQTALPRGTMMDTIDHTAGHDSGNDASLLEGLFQLVLTGHTGWNSSSSTPRSTSACTKPTASPTTSLQELEGAAVRERQPNAKHTDRVFVDLRDQGRRHRALVGRGSPTPAPSFSAGPGGWIAWEAAVFQAHCFDQFEAGVEAGQRALSRHSAYSRAGSASMTMPLPTPASHFRHDRLRTSGSPR